MYNGTLFLLLLSVGTSIILLFLWLSSRRELNFYLRENRNLSDENKGLQHAVKLSQNRSVVDPDQSRQVQQMQDEINTGCQLIEEQRQTINKLQRLLKQSQDLNKRLK